MSDKPIFKTLWAERGAKQEVDTSKIALGWTAERPPFQWENWSQWRQDAFIAHVNVRGIPEWDEETEYGVGVKSYVAGSNGEVYVSIAPSGGTYPARDPVMDVIKWKKAWLDADGTIGIPKVIGLQQALDNKVDKRDGYELSSNDYTSIEKSKLGGIESNAQRNVPANLSNSRTSSSVTITSSSGTDTTIGGASQTVSGVMVATDKTKLDGLPTGAGGLIPLSGGGTGSSNAAGARLALQLGNHSTHNYGTTANTVMMGNDSRVVRVSQDIAEGLATKADKSINISAGTGLVGGGNLSANRALSTVFGTTANTSAMGNDSRIVNAASKTELSTGLDTKADKTLNISTGVGLVGGGNLSTNRTISANFGSTANTIAMGNDSRIVNGQTSFERLDIGKTAATARAALGLGVQATRWPSLAEVTGKPIHYPTTWNSVDAKPVQATRWPAWVEVTDKPVVQYTGASTTDIMSQKAVTDALTVQGQPTFTASAVFTKSNNNLTATRIVSALGLETGDVIQITGSTSNNRLHTVESITDVNTIVVNEAHRNGAGSLSLVNETATVTFKRIAKWYNAPLGLGQAWVEVTSIMSNGTTYTNTSGRGVQLFPSLSLSGGGITNFSFFITIEGLRSAGSIGANPVVNAGDTYKFDWSGGVTGASFWELR